MKILVTGAKGMLGTDLCRVFQENGHEVVATDIQELNVRDFGSVMNMVETVKPETILHLAALTDVDGCERDPDAAYCTNTLGTQNIALACRKNDISLVYISTLCVFNGEKCNAYTEFDTPDPRNWYSRSKYQGELFIEKFLSRYYIVRAGWMFGGGKKDKKFVARIIELAQKQATLKIVNDKFGSPTYTVDISRGIAHLIETGLYGLYHLVNTGKPASRYEVAEKILEYAGVSSCQLIPVSSAEFPQPATRPRMESGRNYQLELRGLSWMRPWEDALAEYIQELRTHEKQNEA
jgi:dTDP-4-dehydrorhamnose reductase